MPLQGILYRRAAGADLARAPRPDRAGPRELVNYFVGQVVGRLDAVRPAAEVFDAIVAECDRTLDSVRSGELAAG